MGRRPIFYSRGNGVAGGKCGKYGKAAAWNRRAAGREARLKQSEVAIGKAIAPAIEAMGLELWGVEYLRQGRRATLRVFIDCLSGVTLDDCERVSRQVGAILDVEDPIKGEYTLEVSSPGIDRPLFTPPQFERYIGAEVNVRLSVPLDGRRRFRGVLEQAGADRIALLVEGGRIEMPHADIERAGLVEPAVEAARPRGKKRGAKRVKAK